MPSRGHLLVAPILWTLASASRPVVSPSWQLQTSMSTIDSLERASGPRPLSLLTGMFDEETGLCSEGIWHNAMLGTSRVLCARELRQCGDTTSATRFLASAQTLGDSLYRLGFDGKGFRRRFTSDIWEDATEAEAFKAAGEDPNFYLPSEEHRCISSAAAVIFYSLLAQEGGDAEATERCTRVGDAFTEEFFDTTSMRFRRSASSDYWRAVDQAVGCLACLRLANVGHNVAANRAMASCAADSLLREFGYSLYATEGQPPGTYLGRAPMPPRNSWHDSLVAFSLLASGCLGVGGESPAGLVRAMVESYRNPANGQIRHQPAELGGVDGVADAIDAAVAFTSTQALWSAVVRAADLSSERAAAAGGADTVALRAFHEQYVQPDTGLLPVANLYPDARLWANTEWAAWLLLDRGDFVPRRN